MNKSRSTQLMLHAPVVYFVRWAKADDHSDSCAIR